MGFLRLRQQNALDKGHASPTLQTDRQAALVRKTAHLRALSEQAQNSHAPVNSCKHPAPRPQHPPALTTDPILALQKPVPAPNH